ncbi:hypothetical protein L484_023364 [Morus notabilis]|uniref:Uncharacterized protein n=1 Tax=Morus notabilis TaxID=981085 RepID=W9S5I3_9ROSA|nr:hypothetical protein L484_023364 [Morus notabilis]
MAVERLGDVVFFGRMRQRLDCKTRGSGFCTVASLGVRLEHRKKSFPIYDRLANIFGKDRAIGRGAETPVENMNQEVDVDDATEEDDSRSVNQTSSRPSNRRKRCRLENM